MKILLWSNHRHGSYSGSGVGLHPRAFTSGSGHYIHDALAKGLAELGHKVFYYLEAGAADSLPEGVERITAPPESVDILHNYSSIVSHAGLANYVNQRGIPWVATCHLDIQDRGADRSCARSNWIFVSRTLARLYGRDRYVHNGVDPSNHLYAETKEDYFFFISSMDWAFEKGLDTALCSGRVHGIQTGRGRHECDDIPSFTKLKGSASRRGRNTSETCAASERPSSWPARVHCCTRRASTKLLGLPWQKRS